MKRIGVPAILILAFFGLMDSVYLAEHAATGTPLLCPVENLSGCNIVAASDYARLFGIPLAELGVVFYGVLFILAAVELALSDRMVRRLLQAGALVGVIASLCFTLIQMFLIRAFCIYCLVSAIIALLIFIFACFIEPISLRRTRIPSPPPFSMPPAA